MRPIAILSLFAGFVLGPGATAGDSPKEVDQVFMAYAKSGSPGCALGVVQDGNFVYRKGFGLASLELGVPLSSQSVFYMGSVSKQFTAASVVLAAEQGFLSLDDNVRKFLPELPDYGHPITLRQMLHHTSGLRDFLTLLGLAGREAGEIHSEAEIIDLIARQKNLNSIPGEEWLYSNTNYFLLGVVVKRATKKSLAEFAAENIFKPLEMAHTRFYDDHTVVLAGRAAAYDAGKNGDFLVDWSTDYDIVGAGGLMSTVDDMLLWDRNFYANTLGKGTLLKELQTRGVLNNGKQIGYALGLQLDSYRGLPVVEHDGALYGYRTGILRFPEQKFSVICLCNVSSAGVANLSRRVADIYLRGVLGAEEDAPQTASTGNLPDVREFAGKYLDPRKHFVYTFTASGGNLAAWGASLRRIGPNQFKDLGTGTITFEGSGSNKKATLEMDGEAFFAGRRVETPHRNDQELAGYAGQYRSEELGASYRFSVEGGDLVLRRNWDPPLPLTALTQNEFECSDLGATIVFEKDASNRVRGLRVYEVNARDIKFVKVK